MIWTQLWNVWSCRHTFKQGTQSKSMALSARHREPVSDQYTSAPQRPAVFRHTHTTYIDRKEWEGGRCLLLPTWVRLCKWLLCNLVLITRSWMTDGSECGQLWQNDFFYNRLFGDLRLSLCLVCVRVKPNEQIMIERGLIGQIVYRRELNCKLWCSLTKLDTTEYSLINNCPALPLEIKAHFSLKQQRVRGIHSVDYKHTEPSIPSEWFPSFSAVLC